MKKIILILAVLALVIVPVFAGKEGNNLTIAGSTTVLPIAQSCAEAYMNIHTEANISVRGGGSSLGIANVIAGTVDIGDASRHAKTKEKAQARAQGVNLVENVVANDAIAIIVNPSNTIDTITIEQIKGIYSGSITNWKDLGGKSQPIVVVSRDVSSGTFEVFNEKVMGGSQVLDSALMLASNNPVATTVKDTPGAIGYVGIGYLSSNVKGLMINDVMPSKETVLNKTYPIARTLHMYTNGRPRGMAKKYIDFVLSPAGQKLVEENGFIGLK
ncbi:MAG: PstS family phosphate ABC transporter substrate-binding protein [Candidatus Cloacimonetes bacterium]|nr:PstS family phosphate ABC transporter substrate-binding protein [Candidatus Cloacimonadota bacterium]